VNKVDHHENEASTKGPESAPKGWGYGAMKQRIGHWRDEEVEKRREQETDPRKRKEGQAYLFGNTASGTSTKLVVCGETNRKADYCGERRW
jgi:hypothetical protein